MKVLLVSANLATTPYPVYPLGMGMVAAALSKAGHVVNQFDLLAENESLDALAETVIGCAPQIVGISIRNIDNVNLLNEQRYIHLVKDTVDRVRTSTRAKVVLGGSGFSLMPEAILAATGADYGIVGEGEAAMVDFLAGAESGDYPREVIIRPTGSRLLGAAIPSAAYDPHLMRYYLGSGNVAAVQTKRGCSHRCAYCSYPTLEGRTIRCREPNAVVDDVERLAGEFGAEMIFFTDSVFNDDDGHYRDLLETMRSRNVNVPWTAFIKPGDISPETVQLMLDTGLKAVELGSDAPTDTTLAGLAKSYKFDDVVACNELFADHGIAVAHYFMFGCPGETEASVRQGIDNVIGLRRSVSFIFMGIRILPDTPLEKIAIDEGSIAPEQDLLDPVYYLAPGLDRDWLESTLTESFKGIRTCVFPPDAHERSVKFLHKLGHAGLLWDMLIR